MFTGIIEKVGGIEAVSPAGDSRRVVISTGYADLELGESVAVNGVCLTVVESTREGEAAFFVSPETLALTNLGSLAKGARVNLERALTLSKRLSGHLVQGHVDGIGKLVATEPADGGSIRARFSVSKELGRSCVHKGSIAINGVSLTINALSEHGAGSDAVTHIDILLIPHTWAHTNLSDLRAGDPVNVEVDVLAKYVAQTVERILCRT